MKKMILLALLGALFAGVVSAQATATPAPIAPDTAGGLQFASEIVTPDVVNALAFSPDGSLLLTANQDTSVRLYSLADGEQVSEVLRAFLVREGRRVRRELRHHVWLGSHDDRLGYIGRDARRPVTDHRL
ncbi:MAG: hypothetical protein HND48_05870 [Chloroflexi bacterium]|nr:hypothetical protein [Chloroflexota bacterium]